ncbi:hypothetical protein LX36DRAFT_663375 [Colletotrichum falcatum]|nr:hypothetical protein LX36DRAFT_663375 [Colletotrichum falcatum]
MARITLELPSSHGVLPLLVILVMNACSLISPNQRVPPCSVSRLGSNSSLCSSAVEEARQPRKIAQVWYGSLYMGVKRVEMCRFSLGVGRHLPIAVWY